MEGKDGCWARRTSSAPSASVRTQFSSSVLSSHQGNGQGPGLPLGNQTGVLPTDSHQVLDQIPCSWSAVCMRPTHETSPAREIRGWGVRGQNRAREEMGQDGMLDSCGDCHKWPQAWSLKTTPWDLPRGPVVKTPPSNAGGMGLIIGGTDAEAEIPTLWPRDAKNWLIGKDPDAGKDWGQEEKGTIEDEMVGWHHWLDEHELEQALGVGDGQGSLACMQSIGLQRMGHDWATELNWTEGNYDLNYLTVQPMNK